MYICFIPARLYKKASKESIKIAAVLASVGPAIVYNTIFKAALASSLA
jgi:hypothetical protein